MRFATWNINSLNVRLSRVEEWITAARPDVLCLQETKLADEAFPALTFQALGYETIHVGEGRWNGVAIVSRIGLDDVVTGFAGAHDVDAEARLVTATCGGVSITNVYVPNGRDVGAEHYEYKLAWLDRLAAHLDAVGSPDTSMIVAGDFNIAPADIDVYDPEAFEGATHVSGPERERLVTLLEWGLIDTFRAAYPDTARVYAWWDYRRGDFHQGRGMRIDLVLATKPLADRATWCIIDRNARKGRQPSDHAPVVVDFA